jgi:hypothetical protein
VEIEDLSELIDQLAASEASAYCDGESLVGLVRQLNRLEAVVTKAASCFDSSGEWEISGARNAAVWLSTECNMRKSVAKQMFRRGRELRRFPAFSQSWSSGEITGSHLDLVASLRRPSTESALERDEEMLLEFAKTLSYDSYLRALNHWEQLADPDGTDESAEERRNRRDVYLHPSLNGMWFGKMTLDPISGEIVSKELNRIEQVMFEMDWAEASERLGRDPAVTELMRNPSQRRADALVEMAIRSQIAPAQGRRPEPLFTVLVDYETFRGRFCELANGRQVVTPGALVPWLDGAYIERAVFRPQRRVEVSATARFFTGAIRRALEVRDLECTHPYCDLPASRCQADHIVPYTDGGLTTQENGRILCGFHNRLAYRRRHEKQSP